MRLPIWLIAFVLLGASLGCGGTPNPKANSNLDKPLPSDRGDPPPGSSKRAV